VVLEVIAVLVVFMAVVIVIMVVGHDWLDLPVAVVVLAVKTPIIFKLPT
jgi:hypothetical protein